MNKKKILGGITVLAIAAVAAWNVNLNAQKSDLSDLALANVEALAQETSMKYETKSTKSVTVWDDDNKIYQHISVTTCEGKGSIDC